MRARDLFGFAGAALRGHRLRSTLSLLGVAIGVASVILLPNWTEAPEPGGVNCTTRKPLSNAKSASSLHPRRS